MAMIQGSTGIAEMVSSLSVLLRNVATGTDELITTNRYFLCLKKFYRFFLKSFTFTAIIFL